ncbi:hypothetical protein DU478_04845 [Thalassococcus profundi]|uniref:Uncharacterized protein n=1 Tax=Thalassococcus profundi TaxID=2282382 RepID=A0A369TQS4_9RHOB|nr:hypothetical protein [Thalassococcus profundi]RDD67074.1 hypothetical protein DU478_04845 [Thalassococcus profundi]
MSLITPKDRLGGLEEERVHIALILRTLKSQLNALNERVAEKDLGDPAAAGKLLGEVRYWLKAARETEAELDTAKRQRDGISEGYGIDLDHARTEIGCRLARLRTCCRSG